MSRNRARLRDAVIVLLALACLGLGNLVYEELAKPEPILGTERARREGTTLPITPPAVSGDAFALPPLQGFVAIAERPLFTQTRRPPEEGEKSLGELASFSLDGIIVSPGGRSAVVLHGTPPEIAHVREGQEIDGWTVSAIFAERIVLIHDGTRHELKLRDKSHSASRPSTPLRRFPREQ